MNRREQALRDEQNETFAEAYDPKNVFHLYWKAGHDIATLFRAGGSYQCARCGAHQIDLSEDLMYGPMTRCSYA